MKRSATKETSLGLGAAILMTVACLEGVFLAFTLVIEFLNQRQDPRAQLVLFKLWGTPMPWVLAFVGAFLGVLAVSLQRWRLRVLWLLGSVGYCAAAVLGLSYSQAEHVFSGGGWVLYFVLAPFALPLVLLLLWWLEVRTRPES